MWFQNFVQRAAPLIPVICSATCLAVSMLSSSSVLGAYILRGHFYDSKTSSAPTDLEEILEYHRVGSLPCERNVPPPPSSTSLI